jgi:hypothetical protein
MMASYDVKRPLVEDHAILSERSSAWSYSDEATRVPLFRGRAGTARGGYTPLDDSGMAQDESGVRLGGGLGGPNKDSPVVSLSRLRPRAAV